jgi:hypothetical protein
MELLLFPLSQGPLRLIPQAIVSFHAVDSLECDPVAATLMTSPMSACHDRQGLASSIIARCPPASGRNDWVMQFGIALRIEAKHSGHHY